MEIAVSCSNAPFPFFFLSQTWNLLCGRQADDWSLIWCKQFCQLFFPLNEILCCLVNCEFPKANFLLFLSLCELPFSTKIPTFVVFQSFKTSCSKQQLWPALAAVLLWFKWHVIRPKTHAIEACIFKCDVNKKNSHKENRSRNLISVPHGPSKNTSCVAYPLVTQVLKSNLRACVASSSGNSSWYFWQQIRAAKLWVRDASHTFLMLTFVTVCFTLINLSWLYLPSLSMPSHLFGQEI